MRFGLTLVSLLGLVLTGCASDEARGVCDHRCATLFRCQPELAEGSRDPEGDCLRACLVDIDRYDTPCLGRGLEALARCEAESSSCGAALDEVCAEPRTTLRACPSWPP